MLGVLAKRLLLARKDLDWNQIELAERSGVSRQYIGDLENGRVVNPTIDIIAALAGALNIPAAHLAGWEDDPSGEGATPVQMEPRLQEIVDLFEDLDPAGQVAAREILRTLRSTQHVRVIGS